MRVCELNRVAQREFPDWSELPSSFPYYPSWSLGMQYGGQADTTVGLGRTARPYEDGGFWTHEKPTRDSKLARLGRDNTSSYERRNCQAAFVLHYPKNSKSLHAKYRVRSRSVSIQSTGGHSIRIGVQSLGLCCTRVTSFPYRRQLEHNGDSERCRLGAAARRSEG